MNPILEKYNTVFDSIPFNSINTEHYMPAIEKGIELANSAITSIIENKDEPNFENTIEALELSSELLDKASELYFNLYSLESDDDFKSLADKISPMLASFSSKIYTNEALFKKVEVVYKGNENLSSEEKRLLEITYKSFTRNGALLKDDEKKALIEIDNQLSTLSPKFQKNVLDATNDFTKYVENIEDVAGIPELALNAARELAIEKGYDRGWVFTIQMPSYIPVLKYADNRELRKALYFGYGTKNLEGDFDNRETILETVKLRDKRAKILGYSNHSEYILEKRMASSPDRVLNFLDDIYKYAYPAAKNELEEVKQLAKELDNIDEIQPWDSAYYTEKLKNRKFNFNSEDLRPYLKSENVINGVFEVATKLYGINFNRIESVEKYHKEVDVFEVRDSKDKHIGLLYVDLFPRSTKRGGAWMNTFRTQGLYSDGIKTPHILISGNLTPSTGDTPSLLSFDETRTVFHEFGHALHGLFSDVKYKSMASPNVYWDFVELPSQIMENWLLEKETLEIFAKHYETGEVMPDDLIKKIKESQTFNAGNFNNRQLSLGYLDMMWHTTDPKEIKSVEDFEKKAMDKTRLLPLSTANTSTGFSHIFAGGYSSGYYSYKWAEVLDADAFEYFKEKGIFNREIASSFKELLSKGNSIDPMVLYSNFRGQEPDPKSLLKRDGLL